MFVAWQVNTITEECKIPNPDPNPNRQVNAITKEFKTPIPNPNWQVNAITKECKKLAQENQVLVQANTALRCS